MGGSGVDGSVDEEAFLSEAGMGSVGSGDGMAGAAALRLRAEVRPGILQRICRPSFIELHVTRLMFWACSAGTYQAPHAAAPHLASTGTLCVG